MIVHTFATPGSIADPAHTVQGCFVVVLDVLRATSTIITALSRGARAVIPVEDIPDAIALSRTLGRDAVLLCGERQGVRISGFDLGNSPLEYTSERVAGRTLVMTTTNGTRAIVAARGAEEIVIGGILNAASVARMAQRSGLSVTLLMAGTQGRFSMEDALGAGAIIDVLPDARPDDLGHACYRLFRESRADLRGALEVCAHYRRLVELGFADDIAWCIKRDALDTVPRFEKDRIVAG